MTREKSLVELINEHLNADDLQLPVYPAVAARLQAAARDEKTNADQIERILLHDAALSSQILRVANSAFYSGLSKVETIKAAIMRLGLDQIVNLAVLCSQRAQFTARDPQIAQYMNKLWKHSLGSALAAKWLAERLGLRERASEAFIGGLFHDIGKLLLFRVLDEVRSNGQWPQALPDTLLMELLGSLHAEQGARLIESWNLPELYAKIIRSHRDAVPDDTNTLSLIVRLADQCCTKLGLNLYQDSSIVLTATPEAAVLGIREVALAELEIMLEDTVMKLAA